MSPRGSAIQCSIEMPGAAAVEGETKPRINAINTDGKLVTHVAGVNSLYDNFLRGRSLAGRSSAAFGFRAAVDGLGTAGAYRWVTWDVFHQRLVHVASGLRRLGLRAGDRVGILAPNSVEWVLAEFAAYYQRLVAVAVYEALRGDALAHVVAQSGMAVVVCTCAGARRVLALADRTPAVRALVVVDAAVGSDVAAAAAAAGVAVHTLRAVEDAGARAPVEPEQLPRAGDVATIIYTSGTSAAPKGVVLTHGSLLASAAGVAALMQHPSAMCALTPADCSMGFLPLAHCLGRMVLHLAVAAGARTAFPRSADAATLVDDLRALQPTVFVGVPRIFSRIHDRVWAQVKAKGGLPAALFDYAYSAKIENLRSNSHTHWLWDRVVFKPLRDQFGGRLRLVVSGSAPISPDVLAFLRSVFSCHVVEGYGLSETMGPTCVTRIDDAACGGSVGAPLPCAAMKLRSAPDLGYAVTDAPHARGEILVRGAHVFSEYWARPDLTAAAFTEDGWLITGDIGEVDERGRFRIIDRRSSIFKLAQGMFVAPERVENIYADHFIVNQAFVYGDPLRSSLVAVIVPDEPMLRMFLKNKGVSAGVSGDLDLPAVCRDPAVRREVVAELAAWGKCHGLAGYEVPKSAELTAVPFDEVGLFTPTYKIKRREAAVYFRDVLTLLYAEQDE
ncbi:medium-chain fatty acid-CoA ligase faa2 [Coemansia sp. RSA 1694]|nr:medium-chain fatty acid-CoA ligase faa2 [Coemansia sp. RSA 1694]